ncbi:GIY-YIG nuclease family protein [Kaistia terrae]|nr:GIY-YIG nuclease family protein [Kaistia terrae]
MTTEGNSAILNCMTPCVYILASSYNGTLYIGVTSNLPQRVWQHREGLFDGFTKRYGVKTLIYREIHDTMESAIGREKQMKLWKRSWKIELIERNNPNWLDLYDTIAL